MGKIKKIRKQKKQKKPEKQKSALSDCVENSDQHEVANIHEKLYFFGCSKHDNQVRFSGRKVSDEQLLYEIETSPFIGYASLQIIIKKKCSCDIDLFKQVCVALLKNNNLKYKTKFIILNSNATYTKYDEYKYFLKISIPNAVLLLTNLFSKSNLASINRARKNFKVPLQEMRLSDGCVLISTVYMGLYLFNINPALCIIINNKYFRNHELSVREGSEKDVKQLCKHLQMNNMPYMLMPDLPRDQLLDLINEMKSADLSVFESVSFIMMTHGDSNGVLYTQDGSIVDTKTNIIQPIQNNTSLRNSVKSFVFAACRGENYPDSLDDDDEEWIENNPTDNSYLQRNTVVLYSVKESLKSPRYADTGTPFIAEYCEQVLHKSEHNDDMTKLAGNLNNELKKKPFFNNMDNVIDCVHGPRQSGSTKDEPCDAGVKVTKKITGAANFSEHLIYLTDLQSQYHHKHYNSEHKSSEDKKRSELEKYKKDESYPYIHGFSMSPRSTFSYKINSKVNRRPKQ